LLFSLVGMSLYIYYLNNKKLVVSTDNMSPTIKAGDTVRVKVGAYIFSSIERFDIVVFKAPEEYRLQEKSPNMVFVNRVIGFPDEKVEIKSGVVFINDYPLTELYVANKSQDNFGPYKIPLNEFFFLGDNRPNSWDSRFWKKPTIPEDDLVGKVLEVIPK